LKRGPRKRVKADKEVAMTINCPLSCKECGIEWNETQDLPMPIHDWIETLKKIKCPICKADGESVLVGYKPRTERGPRLTNPIEAKG
jgi:hypothetical protein